MQNSDQRGAAILTAQNLFLSYGSIDILNDVSLTVHERDRLGIVGRNGAGKSSLLKILTQVEAPSAGQISKAKTLRMGYLSQGFELDDENTVLENILAGASYATSLLEEYDNLAPDSARSGEVLTELNRIDAWSLEQDAEVLMQELGTAPADAKVANLSGGEKRRVALAKTLLAKPNGLILDEPTNHLDTEAIAWLENYLIKFQGPIILITHDRYFLDRVSNLILELEDGKTHTYEGNYTQYMELRAGRMERLELEDHKRTQLLKKELAWLRAGVKARTTKSKSRIHRYHEEADKEKFQKDPEVDLIIPRARVMGNKTVSLTGVSKAYGEKSLFESLSYEFEPDKRIGIVGRNGLGKSTLLKMILGEVEPDAGSVSIGPTIEFNYVDQGKIILNPDNTVLEEMSEGSDWISLGAERISVRGYLRRFLFTNERINLKVGRLSGGEKSRLLLAKILKRGGNFLILDEPTNDLDLPTLRTLEDALIQFEGCVIVVSHDRYFLNRVCEGIFAFEGEGKLVYQEGSYDYYLEKFLERKADTKQVKVPIKEEKVAAPKKKDKKSKLTWKEERELESMEENIFALEAEIDEIDVKFADPEFFNKHGDEMKVLNEKRATSKAEVDRLYSRWEELENISEN